MLIVINSLGDRHKHIGTYTNVCTEHFLETRHMLAAGRCMPCLKSKYLGNATTYHLQLTRTAMLSLLQTLMTAFLFPPIL